MHLLMKEENNDPKTLDQETIPHVSNETGGLSYFVPCSGTVRQFGRNSAPIFPFWFFSN